MKLFVLVSILSIASAAKLPNNNYLPPPSNAQTAGGANFLQAPSQPSPKYIAPSGGQSHFQSSTTFNQGGQPVSFRQGGYTASSYDAQASGTRPQYQQQYGGSSGGSSYGGGSQSGQYGGGSQGGQYGGGASQGQPIPILRYENNNNGDGTYNFDYATGNGIMHQERGYVNGEEGPVVQGEYSYTGDDGKEIKVTYTADATGFHPVGDHLPTPPPIPEAIQRSLEENAAAQGRQHYNTPGGAQPWNAGSQGAYSAPENQYLPPNKQQQQPRQYQQPHQQSSNPQTGYQY